MSPATTEPPQIIVIEDNLGDVRLLQQALDELQEPYRLEVLEDGETALRFLAEQAAAEKAEPCLVILDLHLPRYEGTVVLEAIRQHPRLAHLKLAVLTTLASPTQEASVKAWGVQLYRVKPKEWEGFLQLGQELMALCKQHSQRATSMG